MQMWQKHRINNAFISPLHQLSQRQTAFQKIENTDYNILSQNETQLTQTLLYGNQTYHSRINSLIIISTMECLLSTERCKCLLFNEIFLSRRLCQKLNNFLCSGMLINTVPDDCLMYISFNLL